MLIDAVELQLKKIYTMDIEDIDERIYGIESSRHIFCTSIGNSNVEQVAMLSLDSINRILNYFTVSIGSINSVRVSFPQLFKVALLSNASKIIVAHNHPSGILVVTSEDIEMTRKIGFFAKTFDIELIDSIIVSGEQAISMREYCKDFKYEPL